MRRLGVAAIVAVLLATAVVVQVSLLSRLPVPAATPDLVLVVAVAVGYTRGPATGAAAGFGGGLLLDLAPPADHPAGQWALVLTVAGYLAGRFGPGLSGAPPWRLRPVGALGAGALGAGALGAGATLGYSVLSAALGGGWPETQPVAVVTLAAGVYAAALAVPVVPVARLLLQPLTEPSPRW